MKLQYRVKNITDSAIFWWVGPNAFPAQPLKVGHTSETYDYKPELDWFNVIDDSSKEAISQIKFPKQGDVLITIKGKNQYCVEQV